MMKELEERRRKPRSRRNKKRRKGKRMTQSMQRNIQGRKMQETIDFIGRIDLGEKNK